MKVRPRSLAGQLLALLMLAVLLAHVVGVVMLSRWRSPTEIHPLSARAIETHVASAYIAATDLGGRADRVLAALSQPDSLLRTVPAAPTEPHPMDAQEQAMADRLQQRTGLAAGRVRVQLHAADSTVPLAPPSLDADPALDTGHLLDLHLQLPDGRWLHSRQRPLMLQAHWKRVLAFSIPVGLLPVMLIAVLFARRIMRPLHALTVAARRFSRGEQGAPITPEGPSDIRELADSFNDMQYRLTRFVKDRMRMVASIGHDLRTPLTSLRIRAEFIDDPSLRQDIVSTVDEMTSLVEQTLQFAKDDAHQEPTREVDLAGLIAQVVAHHRAIGTPVDSRIAGPLRYRCRPVHLRRALDNLIGNAARHCRTRVEVSMDRAAGDIRIQVADDGPGIPPALLGQAFEPFVSLDPARSRKGGGGGLGLAIARSSIHAHGGEVTLDNRDEGGLVATVRLPA